MSAHLIAISPEPASVENRKALLDWSNGKRERHITAAGLIVEVSDAELVEASRFGNVSVLTTKTIEPAPQRKADQ